MRTAPTRLPMAMLLTAMLLAPAPALATVYKCVDNNQTTYSTEPCSGHPLEVNAPISVTPAYVPPEPVTEKKSGGSLLARIGVDGKDLVTGLLFALIPLSFLAMFMFSRKSQPSK